MRTIHAVTATREPRQWVLTADDLGARSESRLLRHAEAAVRVAIAAATGTDPHSFGLDITIVHPLQAGAPVDA